MIVWPTEQEEKVYLDNNPKLSIDAFTGNMTLFLCVDDQNGRPEDSMMFYIKGSADNAWNQRLAAVFDAAKFVPIRGLGLEFDVRDGWTPTVTEGGFKSKDKKFSVKLWRDGGLVSLVGRGIYLEFSANSWEESIAKAKSLYEAMDAAY